MGNPVNAIDMNGDSVFIDFTNQKEILGYINQIAEGVFDVDENGYLIIKQSNKEDSKGKYSKYYRDQLIAGIKSKSKINVSISNKSSKVNFCNMSYDLHDLGEGFTITSNDETQAWIYISGKENSTLKDERGRKVADEASIILAHEFAGHAIPSTINYTDYDDRYDGYAVTAENIIRKETGLQQRPWNSYASKDVGSSNTVTKAFMHSMFPKINF